MTSHDTLQIVGPKDQFPKVTLVEPVKSWYFLLALEVDRRPPFGFFIQSRRKRQLIDGLKILVSGLHEDGGVIDSSIFKALLIPPGKGAFLKKRPNVEIAKYDVVLLVEFADEAELKRITATKEWTEAVAAASNTARKTMQISASNVRRIGAVDHSRDGVFLFNYFYADHLQTNLDVWQYTAGWFQDQTALDNSTVLLPKEGTDVAYTIINHCRWDGLGDILPALLFNKTFRPFVLANFEKNNTAAMPILYRLA